MLATITPVAQERKPSKIKTLGVVKTYLGFGKPTRVVFALMFGVGVVMCVSLWLTDVGIGFTEPRVLTRFNAAWLHSHAYIPNILAGLTGFLIGVPVALIVLETIKSDYARNEQINAVNRITRVAWRDFSAAVAVVCSDARIKTVEQTDDDFSLTGQVQAECTLIIESLEACRDAIRKDRTTTITEVTKVKKFIAIHTQALQKMYDAVTKGFGTDYEFERQWSHAVALWEVIDTHIRLRRMEFDLEKMDTNTYIRLRRDMTSPKNGVSEFLDVHSRLSEGGNRVKSVRDLLIMLDVLLKLPDEQLAKILDKAWSEYFGSGLQNYRSEAHAAATLCSTTSSV